MQAPEIVKLPPAFKPAWWLRNCHLQTIVAKYLAPRRALVTEAEMLALPDGDRPAFEALLQQALAASAQRRDLSNQVMQQHAQWQTLCAELQQFA